MNDTLRSLCCPRCQLSTHLRIKMNAWFDWDCGGSPSLATAPEYTQDSPCFCTNCYFGEQIHQFLEPK